MAVPDADLVAPRRRRQRIRIRIRSSSHHDRSQSDDVVRPGVSRRSRQQRIALVSQGDQTFRSLVAEVAAVVTAVRGWGR